MDAVLLVDVYHHIEARTVYFRKLLGSLRPGGRLVVVDFKKGNLPVGPPDALKIAPEQVVEKPSRQATSSQRPTWPLSPCGTSCRSARRASSTSAV